MAYSGGWQSSGGGYGYGGSGYGRGGRRNWNSSTPNGPPGGYPQQSQAQALTNPLMFQGQAPQILVNTLQQGEHVDVFHRYAQDPNGYFMCQHSTQGIHHPSIGKTDGWTEGVINESWDISRYNPSDFRTWVEIRWQHPLWYNRRGHRLDVSRPDMITQRVMPEQIRQRDQGPSEVHQQPRLTLFHLRWGGEQLVNPVTEGQGGWGQIGSTPSDNYINGWETTVFNTIGPTYEIFSGFIQSSAELDMISPQLVRHLLKGQHVGALYFMWPIVYQDGHEHPAYVESEPLLRLMLRMEASGIHTRFPHQSHLYRIFASKEWTSQMCLHPLLRTPLTTKVARQAVATDPAKAAANAMQALNHLAQTRLEWAMPLGQDQPKPGPITHGVAKLGWSWEAMDVRAWKNKHELQEALLELMEQPGSYMESIYVQEWVDFDVELRHFIVEADLARPATWKPKKIIYTVFKSKENGSFRDFDRYDRKGCLRTCFHNDDAALADAEQQCEELIGRWLQWFQAQSHELPIVIRFDILAKRLGPGRAAVTTGELTELGGCFLGWPNGPAVVMGAMLRSCFRDPVMTGPY